MCTNRVTNRKRFFKGCSNVDTSKDVHNSKGGSKSEGLVSFSRQERGEGGFRSAKRENERETAAPAAAGPNELMASYELSSSKFRALFCV